MSEFKKLFQAKRILAMILAVAMVVTMLPQTTYAATVTDSVLEQSGEAETSDVADTEESVDVADAEESSVAADAATEEESVVETTPAEETSVEETPAAEEGESVAVDAADETTTKDVYEIVDEIGAQYKTAVYNGSSQFTEWNVNSGIVIKKNGEDYTTLYYASSYSDLAGITTKWQEEKDGQFVDMAESTYPTNAGNYKLVVELPKVDNVHDGATAEISFTITKSKLVAYVYLENVQPGTKASDIRISSLYEMSNDSYVSFYYTPDNAETTDVNENADSKLSFTKTVRTIENEAVADDAVLVKNKDYVVDFTIAFTDKVTAEEKANYELQTAVAVDVNMSGLISTNVNVELTDKWKETGFVKLTYTGAEAVAPVKDTDYTVKVQYENGTDADGNTVYAEIADAAVTGAWCDEYGNELETVPVNVGTYYYKLSYAGETGIYAKSYSDITVVIEPAVLTIKPEIKANAVFYAGTTVKTVLSQIDYKVYNAAGEVFEIDRNNFWGVSCDDSDSVYKTQPYEPVFKVQVADNSTDVSGNAITVWSDMTADASLESGKSYRIIFSGNKGVYMFYDGTYECVVDINDSDVNSATDNYSVNVTTETLEQNTADVTVKEGVAATIDVTAILGTDKAGESYEKPITKVYDTKSIYELRADYKKAVVNAVENGQTKKVADATDKAITYTWYRQSGTKTENEKEVPVWRATTYRNSPVDAGNYKLEITYKDSNNVYHAEPAAVYYTIEKQKVKVVPTGEYTALTDMEVSTFLDITDITYEIWTVPAEGTGEKLAWDSGDYEIYWDVEKQTDQEKDTWESASYEAFAKDTAYRLAVDELYLYYPLSKNYVNYEVVTEGEGENQVTKNVYLNETKAITVNAMGTTELEVKVDETKLTTKTKEYDAVAIDITQDIANGLIKIVKKEDQTAVTDAEVSGYWIDNETGDVVDAPVNGGTYTYYVAFLGSETYKAFGVVETVTVTITPKDVTVIPVVNDTVVAGTYYYNAYNYSKTIFDGVVEADKDAFTYKRFYVEDEGYYSGWQAIEDYNSIYFSVYDENGNAYYQKLKGAKTYTVRCTSAYLWDVWARNYNLKWSDAVSFTTVRGNSTVVKTNSGQITEVKINDTIDGMNHTIVSQEGISYCYNVYNSTTQEYMDGNFIAVKIQMPAEYDSLYSIATERYENSIKEAGGFVASTSSNSITVVFDASAKDKKEFKIRWEDGYVENFTLDLTNAILLDDLTKAVAPKSIAFNSPVKKMVVGGTQQLDVKLTKVQESDIIRLTYDVDKKDVLCVSESGYVTALATGTATVTVYPSKMVDGKLVPIEGAKKATVTIKVSDVTAPKIKKVYTADDWATVQYSWVSEGYRDEIYVLEGKNKTVQDFESAIDSMKNGKWEGIFAIEPCYGYHSSYDKNTMIEYLYGLQANTDYTVYVRNVSAIRTLDDGCKVSKSYAGSVKSFTTTKSQAVDLRLNYNSEDVTYNYETGYYDVKLSKGVTTLTVDGLFREEAENVAADSSDEVWYSLPLTKEQQKNFVNPKLVYHVGVPYYSWQGDKGYLGSYYDENEGEWFYLYSSSLASADKKGKVKLNGVGKVVVGVTDTNTGVSTWKWLNITAAADSITGKNTKLQVGQSVYLARLLTYKEGRKVLTGNYSTSVVVDDALKKAFADSEYFELNGNYVTAVKAGGSLEIELKDAYVGDMTAKVKLQSTALDPVKNLKSSVITDQYIDLEFTHSGYAEAFRITVTDGRGSCLSSAYVTDSSIYNSTTGKYEYRVSGLTKKSKYNVAITAIYGDVESAEAKKAFTTTLLPASYVSLGKYKTGGVEIRVQYKDGSSEKVQNAYLVSGNTYTLNTDGSALNKGAKYALTDTLTWTSSNNKVATVKANAGTYTATLKAVGQGSTTIEIKSKITKAVIARYSIYVSAVGNAYSYYGDNEQLEKNTVGSSGSGSVELTLDSAVSVSVSTGYQWLSFTAPASGYYAFTSSDSSGDPKAWFFYDMSIGNNATSVDLNTYSSNYGLGYNDDGADDDYNNFYKEIYLYAGQTVYVAVGRYSLDDSMYATVSVSRVY